MFSRKAFVLHEVQVLFEKNINDLVIMVVPNCMAQFICLSQYVYVTLIGLAINGSNSVNIGKIVRVSIGQVKVFPPIAYEPPSKSNNSEADI